LQRSVRVRPRGGLEQDDLEREQVSYVVKQINK
jgi:hypothetical protein